MRQNHPKMVFGGILDRLEAISIPSVSIAKGIKDKNSVGGNVAKVVNRCLHRCQRTRQSEYIVW